MKSLLRFFLFASVLATCVAGLYFLRNGRPDDGGTGQQLPALAALDREFTTLVASVVPSVVSINAIPANQIDPRANPLQFLLGGAPGAQAPPELGSGAIVSRDGFIVTNCHVINHASAVEVQLNDGRTLPAKFVGADAPSDVAILKVDAQNLTPLPFGDSDAVLVGQTVFAVGNPFGLQESVTKGIISAKGRRTMSEASNEFFQTDAPINPGNSGGPLVDLKGRLIGLNNAILLRTDGIGFAIPSNTVRRIFESIRDHGRFIRPWFGVNMIPLTPALAAQLQLGDIRGALVGATVENSPASRAGVQPGDVIISFNGRQILDWIDLRNRVAETDPGKQIPLVVKRAGHEINLTATAEKQPGE